MKNHAPFVIYRTGGFLLYGILKEGIASIVLYIMVDIIKKDFMTLL